MVRLKQWGVLLALCAGFLVVAVGCGKDDDKDKDKQAKAADKKEKEKEHDHGEWWCDEHGIPEEICSMCSKKYAAECKKKGDWCVEHKRADSQCFICHPEHEAKFAKMFEEKYPGKKMPKRTE